MKILALLLFVIPPIVTIPPDLELREWFRMMHTIDQQACETYAQPAEFPAAYRCVSML
jgi:hypothetical protein